MGQIEFPGEANWVPLRLVIADEKTRGKFMFVGTFVASGGTATRIELYKHESSRRYLNADAGGDCYFYDAAAGADENPYRKISRREALNHVGVNLENK